jgi:hypothetical protein
MGRTRAKSQVSVLLRIPHLSRVLRIPHLRDAARRGAYAGQYRHIHGPTLDLQPSGLSYKWLCSDSLTFKRASLSPI